MAWAGHELSQIAPSTAKRYGVSLAQCEPFLARFTIDKIDGLTINSLITGRQKARATHATIRRDLTAVSRVLTYAESQGWRDGNPTLSKRRTLKERRDPIELPTDDAIVAVLASASARLGALIVAARLTGCRQDELVRLTWRAFNRGAGTLDVIGKGNKRRTLDLSAQATAHFSAQPATLGSDVIFCRDGGDVFAQAASDFCHVRRVAEAKAKAKKLKFPRFRFHDLRHLFAVEALRGGMDIYTLSKHLGHTSVLTTEIYLEFLTPAQAAKAKAGSAQNDGTPRRF